MNNTTLADTVGVTIELTPHEAQNYLIMFYIVMGGVLILMCMVGYYIVQIGKLIDQGVNK